MDRKIMRKRMLITEAMKFLDIEIPCNRSKTFTQELYPWYHKFQKKRIDHRVALYFFT